MKPSVVNHHWLPSVGVDLVSVTDVERALVDHGHRYLSRVYTSEEVEYASRSPTERSRRLAARFAAKEATLKILRPEGRWLDWRLIEVIRSRFGDCSIALHGEAAQMAQAAGFGPLSVSLSHEHDLAVAVVMGLQRSLARSDAEPKHPLD